jgi:hypothetical protein
MKYLKKYNDSKENKLFENTKEFNDVIQQLKSDPLWTENENKNRRHEYDFRYDLGGGLQLAILKINHDDDDRLIVYIYDGDFNYIDSLFRSYNQLYKLDNPIERFIKIAKVSSQIYTKEDLYPTDEDIKTIIFPEFKEDLGFNLVETKFGFVDNNFPKKLFGNINFPRKEYDAPPTYKSCWDQEVYSTFDHKAQDKPKKVFIFLPYEDDDVHITSEQIEQEFEDCKFRINELGFNVNSKLYITDSESPLEPKEFMVVLEEKN